MHMSVVNVNNLNDVFDLINLRKITLKSNLMNIDSIL